MLFGTEPATTTEFHRFLAQSLRWCARAVDSVTGAAPDLAASSERGPGTEPTTDPGPLHLDKVVGEAALLLRASAPVVGHPSARAAWDALLASLVGPARPDALAASLCLDPGRALETAFAHIQLGALGETDARIDELLDLALLEPDCGPDRPVVGELQRQWLVGLRSDGHHLPGARGLLARSSLGRPIDILRCSTQDVYDLTHAVMHGSDLGRWPVPLPRPAEELLADLDALLGLALDADNLDLTVELLWTWPMLRLPWTPGAQFAFGVVAEAQRVHGFLPGPGFDPRRHHELDPGPAEDLVLRTSYHSTLVLGILAAALLVEDTRPQHPGHPPRPAGRGADVLALVEAEPHRPWRLVAASLPDDQADGLAPLFLAVALRRRTDRGDIAGVRRVLEVALGHDLTCGQVVGQAARLLRRGTALAELAVTTSGPRQVSTARHPAPCSRGEPG